jgi:mRNA interferase MazF
MNEFPKRGEIYWVKLDPTLGTEINKTRPGLIISNDAGNENSNRVIIAPITSTLLTLYPFQVKIEIKSNNCKVLLNQVRAIDKLRLGKYISTLDKETMNQVDTALKIALSIP